MLTHHRDWAVEVQAKNLILDSSVGLMSGHSVCWRLQVPLGLPGWNPGSSAEEDNLSPVRFRISLWHCARAIFRNLTTDNMSSSAESPGCQPGSPNGT